MNQDERIKCDICEYFSGPMTENYFDHFSGMPEIRICRHCQLEAEDPECHLRFEVQNTLESLGIDFDNLLKEDKELENLSEETANKSEDLS